MLQRTPEVRMRSARLWPPAPALLTRPDAGTQGPEGDTGDREPVDPAGVRMLPRVRSASRPPSTRPPLLRSLSPMRPPTSAACGRTRTPE